MSEQEQNSSTPETPWYQEGLRFECTGCGNCCTGAPGYVWVNKQEIAAIAEYLGVSVSEVESRFVRQVGIRRSLIELDNYDCVFLDAETRHCQVYPVRPRQCRTWPFWKSNLQSPGTWKHTCQICPGSGQGKLYGIDQIEEQAAKIRV